MSTLKPRLSVQIVTWNSASHIGSCLERLAGQTDRRFEVVVVDNASPDDSVQIVKSWLEKGLPGILVEEPVNHGFCGGHNRALLRAAGDLILVLNPDVRLPADFVARSIATADRLPADVGSIAPRLVRPDGTLDSTGLFFDRFRRAYDRGQGESPERYSVEDDVLACTGAAALHRRAMLDDIAPDGNPFEEGLFAYYDDLDICWRAQIRGWRCRYVPTLSAEHERGGRNALRRRSKRKGRSRDQILMVRNRLLVMARCERLVDVLTSSPWLLSFELAQAAYLTVRHPSVLRAYVEAFRDMPQALRDRSQIHSRKGAPGRSPRSLVPFQP